jgi:hypothetical protein
MAWNRLEGKMLCVFFDDGIKISFKRGRLEDADASNVFLITNNSRIVIPLARIVRVEEQGGGGDGRRYSYE